MGLAVQPTQAHATICPLLGKDVMTKSRAKSQAKLAQRRCGRPIEAYQCRTCGGWHIGHKRGVRQQ